MGRVKTLLPEQTDSARDFLRSEPYVPATCDDEQLTVALVAYARAIDHVDHEAALRCAIDAVLELQRQREDAEEVLP